MAAQEEFTITTSPDRKNEETMKKEAVIKIVGVGGGGGNAINRMVEADLSGVQFIAINTDPQDLEKSLAPVKLQIGGRTMGAGANPELGREACEKDRERIRQLLDGGDLVFLTLGLGGGTGTGAAPIVAEEAAAACKLVIAIVTLPFTFEGKERMSNALKGLQELEEHVDTLIVIPNDRIAELSNATTSLIDAFKLGDEVLRDGVLAISALLTITGEINLDFQDLCTVMKGSGRTLMGIGFGEGENRAIRAVEEAVECPLLEQSSIAGAKAVILNVHGGKNLLLQEFTQINNYIYKNVGADAKIITGVVMNHAEDVAELQVTVIATGFPKRDIASYAKPPKDDEIEKVREVAAKSAAGNRAAASAGKGAPQKEVVAEKASGKVISATNDGDLFNYGKKNPRTSPFIKTTVEEEEDINIPTFLRKLKRKREGR